MSTSTGIPNEVYKVLEGLANFKDVSWTLKKTRNGINLNIFWHPESLSNLPQKVKGTRESGGHLTGVLPESAGNPPARKRKKPPCARRRDQERLKKWLQEKKTNFASSRSTSTKTVVRHDVLLEPRNIAHAHAEPLLTTQDRISLSDTPSDLVTQISGNPTEISSGLANGSTGEASDLVISHTGIEGDHNSTPEKCPLIVHHTCSTQDTGDGILSSHPDPSGSSAINSSTSSGSPEQQSTLNCYTCGLPEDNTPGGLKKCASCKSFSYCSRDCQREDWVKGHKMVCKRITRSQLELIKLLEDQ